MTIATMNVAELAAERHRLMTAFNSKDVDDETNDLQEFEKIREFEERIEKANFDIASYKAAGNRILMESIPSCWDYFQEALFLRMQQFA
jgi:hypothetical protein